MASRKYAFILDRQTDEDIIEAIDQLANNGPLSKALLRIIYEWYNNKFNQASNEMQSNPNQDENLTDSFNKIMD